MSAEGPLKRESRGRHRPMTVKAVRALALQRGCPLGVFHPHVPGPTPRRLRSCGPWTRAMLRCSGFLETAHADASGQTPRRHLKTGDVFGLTDASRIHVTEATWLTAIRGSTLFAYRLPADRSDRTRSVASGLLPRRSKASSGSPPATSWIAMSRGDRAFGYAFDLGFWRRVAKSSLAFSGHRLVTRCRRRNPTRSGQAAPPHPRARSCRSHSRATPA